MTLSELFEVLCAGRACLTIGDAGKDYCECWENVRHVQKADWYKEIKDRQVTSIMVVGERYPVKIPIEILIGLEGGDGEE